MIKLTIDKLKNSLEEKLQSFQVSEQDADIIAKILIEGDLRGYPTHGTERIFQIIDGIKQKTLDPSATASIEREKKAVTIYDGSRCIGHPAAYNAMRTAILKAKEFGTGISGIINAGHIGILSYYSELASQENCFGLVMCSTSPITILTGGKIKTFGTNPISYAYPTKLQPVIADFATSKVSRATLKSHLKNNKKIPANWAVDVNGNSTENPQEALDGGLKSFADNIKGDMISMLVGVLAGHLLGTEINPLTIGPSDPNKFSNTGNIFIALNIEDFSNLEIFKEKSSELSEFIDQQKASFRTPGKAAFEKKHNNQKREVTLSEHFINNYKNYGIKL